MANIELNMSGTMKKNRIFLLMVLGFLSTECAPRKFRGAAADQIGKGGTTKPVDKESPGGQLDDPKKPVLDVSLLPNNVDLRSAGGPIAGGGFPQAKYPIDLSCEASSEKTVKVSAAANADFKVANNSRVEASIKGRFCPTVSDNLTVLFIIDFSGSMGPNTPDPNAVSYQPTTGNDPRTGQGSAKTCGRLQAVETIMSKFQEADKVNVGMVTFASDIVESHSAAPVTAASFKTSRLNAGVKLNSFCSYIAPDTSYANQEMTVQNSQLRGSTNYAAAFDRAYEYLKTVKGRKAVYFITDGRPTAGGADPFLAGQQSAAQLKTIENLYFNAFFLQYKQSGMQEDKQGFDNLVKTIGAPERVVRVDSAAQLAIEVGKEKPANFDASQIKASLTVDPYQPEAQLKVLSFAQDPANPKAWLYETEAFVLLGKDAVVYPNKVKVTAKALDGTNHSSLVNILYQKTVP
ncbi:MAG: VWA domain-containing protein [Proteobacteria bacterium]|nr:VWA domain-containing protein [Pseudomonadota bacterium]